MVRDSLWKELIKQENLKRGWHLVRATMDKDFAEDICSADIIASDLSSYIMEISNRLSTNTYLPRPLFHVEVPKSSLAIRPGSVISMSDRIVLSAIVCLIAEVIDQKFPDSVYSWRLKKPIPRKGGIFKEDTIIDMPYLKKATIRQKLDPFEPWYANWPAFDKKSRETFGHEGYRYLATSDIAAYFENIQLPILRDQLLNYFPNEPKIINLLFTFLETWVNKTDAGRPHLRGIPQGNVISSFLGNLFLLPLDEAFTHFEDKHDAKYQRYMDDVRIFTKTIETARRAVFLMDKVLRSLHLNVQTAKTKIYDEKAGEISDVLIDPRIDRLNAVIEKITLTLKEKGNLTEKEKLSFLSNIKMVAKEDVTNNRQKLLGARRPLSGLDARTFLRWINAHNQLDSHEYVNRLLAEIQTNPEQRFTSKLIQAARRFPKKAVIETKLIQFIKSTQNIFPYQEAECLRALRYLSTLSREVIDYCHTLLQKPDADIYVRMQAANLLSRTEITEKQITKYCDIFTKEPNPYVQVGLANLLVQRRSNNNEIVRQILLHPNEKINALGKLFRAIKHEKAIADERLKHIFRNDCHWLICDNMPFLHLMGNSPKEEIRTMLVKALKKPRRNCKIAGLRLILDGIYRRTSESLRDSKQ